MSLPPPGRPGLLFLTASRLLRTALSGRFPAGADLPETRKSIRRETRHAALAGLVHVRGGGSDPGQSACRGSAGRGNSRCPAGGAAWQRFVCLANRSDHRASRSLGPRRRRTGSNRPPRIPRPEVRLRAKELLSRLKIIELWAATEMTCPAEAAPASKRLAELAAATGNRVLLGDQYGSFHEQPVTLAAGNRPFWEVVDEVCRTSGNRARPHFDLREPGLVVVAGEPGKHPVALAGPIRARSPAPAGRSMKN